MLKLSCLLFISFVLILSFKSNGGFPTSMNHGNFFPYIIDKPFIEDGFYMMTVAWNIAEGNGIKYNLNRPTTGIQPLVTFIQAGVAKLVLMFGGSKIDFLRVMIIFSALLLFLFSLVTSSIIQKLIPSLYSQIIIILFVLFSFDLFEYFTNGLETGFYLLMIAVCINYSFQFLKNPNYKSAFIFGSLAGITALTRVDFLLPLFVYLLCLFISGRIRLSIFILILTIAVLFLLPWLIYVYSVSGSIYPSSVSNQTNIVDSLTFGERLSYIRVSFLHHLTPFLYTNNLYISTAVTVLNGIIFYYLIKRFKFFDTFDKPVFNNLLVWGFSFFLLGLTYFVYSNAPYFYIRYLTPFYLFIFLIAVCCLLFLLNKIPGLYKKLILTSFVLFFFVQSYYYQFNGNLANHLTLRISFIKNNFNDSERIALFQSGVTGFFLDNVLNLDGKVDHIVRQYALNKNFEGFLDSMKVNIIIEWKNDFNVTLDDNYFSKHWKMIEDDIGDGTTACFVRIK